MVIDRHVVAVIAITGSSLDIVGTLYLAYDLLGGEHGPLRTLMRGVTYGTLFGVVYGLGMGPAFGIAAGVAHGITLAWEYSRASRNQPPLKLAGEFLSSAIRGVGFGAGIAWSYGWRFALLFAAISTVAQTAAYRMGIRPTRDYKARRILRITGFQFGVAVNRSVGYIASTWLAATLTGWVRNPLPLAIQVGLTIGIATMLVGAVTPLVEYTADTIPEKRLAILGLALILCGFFLQSVQYWAVVLDIPVR